MLGKAAQARLGIMPRPSLDRIGRQVRITERKGQKQHHPFATQVTHMDRVSTQPQGCSRGRTLGSKQDPPNNSANILVLEEPLPAGLVTRMVAQAVANGRRHMAALARASQCDLI